MIIKTKYLNLIAIKSGEIFLQGNKWNEFHL